MSSVGRVCAVVVGASVVVLGSSVVVVASGVLGMEEVVLVVECQDYQEYDNSDDDDHSLLGFLLFWFG